MIKYDGAEQERKKGGRTEAKLAHCSTQQAIKQRTKKRLKENFKEKLLLFQSVHSPADQSINQSP